MRIFAAGFQHETNTFAATPAGWDAFESGDFFPPFTRGPAMAERLREAGLPMSGFLARAAEAGCTVVASCWAGASPSAAITSDAFERIRTAMRDDLKAALAEAPLDGIYLDLHGAAVCDHLDNPEALLMHELRALAGNTIPLVASLDLHANVDRAMVDAADYLVAYRTYPHVDMVQTGQAAFNWLAQRSPSWERPPVAFRRLPFLLPIVSQSTLQDPAAATYRLLEELERQHGAEANFTPGFPAADIQRCGSAIWAYGPGAEPLVDEIMEFIVAHRDDWQPRLFDADAAVTEAMRMAESTSGPIVIADVQDNPGAGADGNTTGLLHALLQAGAGRRWPGKVAIGLLYDPVSAARAGKLPVYSPIDVQLGKSVSTATGGWSEPSVTGVATVRAVSDGTAILRGPMMEGAKVDAGPSVCLDIDGILIAVTSSRTQMLDRELFQMVEIDADLMKIVVVKSAVHFRADFGRTMAGCILAKSAGPMAANPADLPWSRLEAGISPGI